MLSGTITITAVERKEGVSQKTGKPWTKFLIHGDGSEYGTFDAALANVAFASVGKRANITWTPGTVEGRNDLQSLIVDESSVPVVSPVSDRTPDGGADWDLIGLRKTRCALWAALFNGQTLAGMPLDSAITHGIALVRAAELDVFHRQPAQAEDDIPF